MFGSVLTILIALLLLSALIFIHELAHFLVGKAVGIHAEVFSIGFGRPLIKFTRGGTEYRLSMIPAGGYVKFPGEYSEDEERLEGEFHQAPIWKRLAVVGAGPLSNILLGAVLFAVLAAGGLPVEPEPLIGEVSETDAGEGSYWDDPSYRSPAAMAGLRRGDRILEVEGRAIDSTNEATQEVILRPDKRTKIKVLREGEELEIDELTPRSVLRGKYEVGQIGVRWMLPLAAYKQGGDTAEPRVIASIGGAEGYLEEALRNSAGKEIEAAFEDGGTGRFTALTRVAVAQEPAEAYANEGVALGSYLTEIDGKPIRSAADARALLLSGADQETRRLTFENDGKEIQLEAALALSISVTAAEADAAVNPAVKDVKPGYRLLSVNGVSVSDYDGALASVERASAEGRLSILEFKRESAIMGGRNIQIETEAVVRDGRAQIEGLTLRSNLAENPSYLKLNGLALAEQFVLIDAVTSERYLVGAAPPKTERHGIGSIRKGVAMAGDSVKEIVSFLKRLITGEVSTKYVSGPVGIVNVTQKMLGDGWTWATVYSVLRLMAWISINLAIVNLLPIPIADGGQILFFLYEGARGRPLSLKIQAAIQNVSIWALMALFAVITLKDILYW